MDIDHLIATSKTIKMRDIISYRKKTVNVKECGDFIYLYYHRHILTVINKNMVNDEIYVETTLKNIHDGEISGKIISLLVSSDSCQKMLKQKSYNRILSCEFNCVWVGVLNEIIIGNDLGIMIHF